MSKGTKGTPEQETKALAPKNANPMAQYGEVDKDLMGNLASAESTDYEFARLTVIQPTSKIKGTFGDVIDSNTNEPVVRMGEKLSVVPLWFFKSYAVHEIEKSGKRGKWLRNETKVGSNAVRSMADNREVEEDGKKVKFEERINLYVILAKDLDEMIPTVYRLLVKPSSFKEMKKLLMDWDIKKKCGQYPFAFIWNFTTAEAVNDQGKFAVVGVTKEAPGGVQKMVQPEQFDGVKYWVKMLGENADKIKRIVQTTEDETDVTPEAKDAISY